MQTCENCGCRIYSNGCVNCDEENYIQEQIENTEDDDVELNQLKEEGK